MARLNSRRKGWMIAGMLLAVVLLISACGGNKENGAAESQPPASASASPSASPSAEASESADSGMRDYESAKGVIQIPAKAERVVVTVPDYVGDVIAAGVTPIGAPPMVFQASYYKEYLNGVENIGDDAGPALEKIVALQPDLIITYNEEAYEALSKVAPTVFIPYGQYAYRERLQEIGRILGRESEANAWLDTFDKAVAEKKELLADVIASGKTVAIFEIWEKELYLYGKSFGRGGAILYDELGLKAPQKVVDAAFENGWAPLSLESIPEYLGEADYLFRGLRDPSGKNQASIESSKIWKDVKAVQAGAVYDYNVDDFYFQDPIALKSQLEGITEFLQKH